MQAPRDLRHRAPRRQGPPPVERSTLSLEALYARAGATDRGASPFKPYACMCAACGFFGHASQSPECTTSVEAKGGLPFGDQANEHKAAWKLKP